MSNQQKFPMRSPDYASSVHSQTAEVDILLLGSAGIGKSTFLARLTQGQVASVSSNVPILSIDLEKRPFTFSVSLFRRPYTFRIWPSTGALFTDPFPSHPHFVVIGYDISSRDSLHQARHYWRKQFMQHFEELEHSTPVMLLGLKRDLRHAGLNTDGKSVCVMPEEGLHAATEMRCDKYAECSALTGELFFEAVEDITRTAAMTTTEKGGLSDGSACMLM